MLEETEKKGKETEKKREETEKKRKETESKMKLQKKQRSLMMSFFSPGSKAACEKEDSNPMSKLRQKQSSQDGTKQSKISFDVHKFRSCLDTFDEKGKACSLEGQPLFPKLSARARASRRRRTQRVSVSVFVSTQSNEFGVQPYLEQKEIKIRNKYKLLQFHEECRPAYYGTWSKSSSILTGKNPIAKDTDFLDYDYDSEAEWELGDDDPGEDVNDEVADEEDENMDDYDDGGNEDGWLAADDDLGSDGEQDEEAKLLMKNKVNTFKKGMKPLIHQVGILAPSDGGFPFSVGDNEDCCSNHHLGNSQLLEDHLYGFSNGEGHALAVAHDGIELIDGLVYLDAFPPALTDEGEVIFTTDPQSGTNSGGKDAGKSTKDPSLEDMQKFARFVHHSKLLSKPKVVEEFRGLNNVSIFSYSKGIRLLDSIAEKKRHPKGGVYWEVKKKVLEELGLQDLMQKTLVFEVEEEKANNLKGESNGSTERKDGTETQAKASMTTPAPGKAASGNSDSEKKKKASSGNSKTGKRKKTLYSSASAALLTKFFKKQKNS